MHENLNVRICYCRRIPHELTSDQKGAHVDWWQEMLLKFNQGRSYAVYDIVTGDVTWVYCYDAQRSQCVFGGTTNKILCRNTTIAGFLYVCTVPLARRTKNSECWVIHNHLMRRRTLAWPSYVRKRSKTRQCYLNDKAFHTNVISFIPLTISL